MNVGNWYDLASRETGTDERDVARLRGYHRDADCGELPLSAPWCAVFANAMLRRAGYAGTGSAMARSFLGWGEELASPREGCIVVLSRGQAPSGHVGFFVRETPAQVYVLGGNQGDKVSVAPFAKRRVLGYRWPKELIASELPAISGNPSVTDMWNRLAWASDTAKLSALSMARRILAGREIYREASRRSGAGIPWYVIGALHAMEASCDFEGRIADGRALPSGTDWARDAADALRQGRFGANTRIWSIERIAAACERWNGLGYRKRGVPSPYLWAGTKHYVRGKFTSDGVYDPGAVSRQIGVLPLLKALSELDPSFRLFTERDAVPAHEVIGRSKSLPAILNALLIGVLGFFTDTLQRAWEFVLWVIGVLPSALDSAEQTKQLHERFGGLFQVNWPKTAMILVLVTLAVVFVREYQRKRYET